MNELNIIRINEAINILKAQINLLERKVEDKYLERKDYDLDLCFGQWLIKNNYVNAHR